MRAIKSLLGLALLGICSVALAQRPMMISEAIPPPLVEMELHRHFPSVDQSLAPPIPPHSIQMAARQDLRPAPMPPPHPPNQPAQMAAHQLYAQPPGQPAVQPEFAPMQALSPQEIVHEPSDSPPSPGDEVYPYEGREYPFGSRCAAWWHQSWYFRAEALFLQRTQGFSDRVLVETNAGLPVITSGDFNPNFVPGVSALIGHRVDCVSAWEIGYFGAQQWNEYQVAASLNNLDLPDPLGAAIDDFNNANVISTRYRSQLHNAEANYLRDHAGLTWLAGFRYLNWDEDLRFNAIDNDGDVSDYIVSGSNNLMGGQMGARTTYRNPCYEWELTGKAGVFGNNIFQRQLLGDDDNTIIVRDVRSRETGVAFVGDINLSGHCQLSDVWRLRAGYNVLWITNLALAPDQLDFTNTLQSGRDIDRGGSIFLHGLNVGIEALW